MMAKTTGAQLRAFFADPAAWPGEPGESYYDDSVFIVNGEEVDEDFNPETVALDAIVSFDGMFCTLDGSGDKPLETHFRQWLKKQNTVYILVKCDKRKEAMVRSAIKDAGGVIAD